jgi:Fe-S-cluster containining protein
MGSIQVCGQSAFLANNRCIKAKIPPPARSKVSFSMSGNKQWWQELGGLPFECTQCGKCCQTKGDVWVNQSETSALAQHFSLPVADFVQKYAEFEADGWIKLRARNSEETANAEAGVGCIFLSDDGKSCTVYPVRPKQCTTYPFFPRLLRTPETWNSEVVSVPTNGNIVSGRQWTVESGGCEGMKEVKNIRWNQKKSKWIVKRDTGADDAMSDQIVAAGEILRRSLEYEDYFATFPHEALLRMVSISL